MRSYTNKQLLRHLDSVLNTFDTNAPFRIDWAYNKIYALDGGVYIFYCSFSSRSCIERAIEHTQCLWSVEVLDLMN